MATTVPDPHLFVFDLDRAIGDQLIEKIQASPSVPLALSVGPKLSGIYALYYQGALVYIGKATKELTASQRDLRARLNEHVGKINGRQNIALSDVTCKYLIFESEWWVIAAEYALSPTSNRRGTTLDSAARRRALDDLGRRASVGGIRCFHGFRRLNRRRPDAVYGLCAGHARNYLRSGRLSKSNAAFARGGPLSTSLIASDQGEP